MVKSSESTTVGRVEEKRSLASTSVRSVTVAGGLPALVDSSD